MFRGVVGVLPSWGTWYVWLGSLDWDSRLVSIPNAPPLCVQGFVREVFKVLFCLKWSSYVFMSSRAKARGSCGPCGPWSFGVPWFVVGRPSLRGLKF